MLAKSSQALLLYCLYYVHSTGTCLVVATMYDREQDCLLLLGYSQSKVLLNYQFHPPCVVPDRRAKILVGHERITVRAC